jgi:uncharacterized protein YdhG (YjbR/CyaY superfamily)
MLFLMFRSISYFSIIKKLPMQSTAKTPDEYIASLPADRKTIMENLRRTIKENLPPGFSESMGYGMLCYSVPHSLYPPGYHCDPKLPLGFISIASQKNFVALYHVGMYSDKNLLDWFIDEYPKHAKYKLDMGKSCVRFKRADDIPYRLIAELAAKMSPEDWIAKYESVLKKEV